jgi:RNA polymerase sigma-70 factor (sigma-E family)
VAEAASRWLAPDFGKPLHGGWCSVLVGVAVERRRFTVEGGRVAEPVGFREFVDAHSRDLLRCGWLLTGEWSAAEDLVQTALAAAWPRWDAIGPADAMRFMYVRRVMMTTYLRWRSRRWVGETPTEHLPASEAGGEGPDDVDLRQSLLTAMSRLPSRQRAAIVLRYFADLSEADSASLMGCSVGALKSHTSRALSRLRATPGLAEMLTGGVM